jgi:putative toxin-antitoxin system antitoxin component (TIGR02293 family)
MESTDQLDRVLDSVEKVYESRERARQWLNRPNPRLGGRAPVTLLDTCEGVQRVEELLGQINEGFFV